MKAKANGYILLSKMEKVKTHMAAWADEVTFVAPYIGEVPADNPYAISNAIHRKYSKPGSIAGSSYGSCSVRVESIDPAAKTVTFTLSYGIGE